MPETLWFNQQARDSENTGATIDRLSAFGDGVFETMLLRDDGRLRDRLPDDQSDALREIRRLLPALVHLYDYHMERLESGLKRLGISIDPERYGSALSAAIHEYVRRAGGAEPGDTRYCVLKLIVGRGYSGFGYAADTAVGNCHVLVRSIQPESWRYSEGLRVGLSAIRLPRQPMLAGIKHCNRLEQVLATRERDRLGFDELLLCQEDGSLVEAISSNLFVMDSGKLVTPILNQAGVAGVMRRCILERIAPALGWRTEERRLVPEDLSQAQGVFLTNAVKGLLPVIRFMEWTYPADPSMRQLLEAVGASIENIGELH